MEGLLPAHLAGADLTGAKLPDEIAKFPALGQVAAISSEARKIFIGLLAACVYSWLVIGTTQDVDLILNTASSPLPIINTPIPIAGFYVVGAILLAAVYCYLHFYLHHLWRMLATLPAVFPDGVTLDDKSDPWPLTNFVRVYFTRLKSDKHQLKRLETVLSIALAWGLVPLTLFALWARYLPSHDWFGTCWLILLTGYTTVLGWHFFRFARASTMGFPFGPAVRLLVLTAARREEIFGLSWREVDRDSAAIRLPAERAKTKEGRNHSALARCARAARRTATLRRWRLRLWTGWPGAFRQRRPRQSPSRPHDCRSSG